MKEFIVFLVGLTVSAHALAAATRAGKKVSVHFDRTAYQLEMDPDALVYRESGRFYSIKVRPCNQTAVRKLASEFDGLMKKYKPKPGTKKTPHDVKVLSQPSGKDMSIVRGSDLGTWLRKLPQNMMYVDAQARISCRK